MRPKSELELIRIIQRTVKTRGHVKTGIGDDCCVLSDGTVLTTDAYAEGVHFDSTLMSLDQVGRRCACAAMSDVVAMGAEPRVLLVALVLTPATRSVDVRDLYLGIERACRTLDCEVAGGDIITSDRLLLALTAIGRTDSPRLRSTARPGESVYVTGHVGSAEAGRLALEHRLPRRRYRRVIERHLYPLPRAGQLKRLLPGINALIDTSDGLATDARHLARESGARVVLEPDRFPILRETKELCKALKLDLLPFALSSGEDYELMFTSSEPAPTLVNGLPVTRIGRVESGSGLYLEQAGARAPVRLSGYDHMSRTPGRGC